MCLRVSFSSSIGLHVIVIVMNVNVCICGFLCICLYIQTKYSLLYIHVRFRISHILDVGALGMIDGGGSWLVASSLFGVVEAVVVLVGVGGGRF